MKPRIRRVVEEAQEPLSANQVAEQANVDWHTAKKYLDRLVENDVLYSSEMSGRLTLYWDRELPF